MERKLKQPSSLLAEQYAVCYKKKLGNVVQKMFCPNVTEVVFLQQFETTVQNLVENYKYRNCLSGREAKQSLQWHAFTNKF